MAFLFYLCGMVKFIIISFVFISCQSKKIANYKVTKNGYEVYRYSKNSEPTKDILSNGDTLVSTGHTIPYIIKAH